MDLKIFKIEKNNLGGYSPNLVKPTVVGFFSIDSERTWHENLSQLTYIQIPKSKHVSFNLDAGRRNAISKDENIDEKIDHILKWIVHNKSVADRVAADFVCFRGVLRLLMCTPYEVQDGWIIYATKWSGTIYLCAKETEKKRLERVHRTDKQLKFLSWGYKFEQYMSSDKPHTKPVYNVPVNEKEEFCGMFSSKLGDNKLLYGAELDGVKSTLEITNLEDLAQAELVELKTNRKIDNRTQDDNFVRFKLMKWWAQSIWVGIELLICGFRDDKGIVYDLHNFDISSFPNRGRRSRIWDSNVCMNFCDRFLNFVKSVFQEDNLQIAWKFEWDPRKDVVATKLTGSSEYSFLPEWFTNQNLIFSRS